MKKPSRLSHSVPRPLGRQDTRVVLGVLLSVLALALPLATCTTPPPAEQAPPLGSVEHPPDGAHLRTLELRGWAGDERGVRSIQVRVDGDLAALGAFTWERDDVLLYYPAFEHGNRRLGWTARVPDLAPGPHVVEVVLVDINGLTSAIGRLNIVIESEQIGSSP